MLLFTCSYAGQEKHHMEANTKSRRHYPEAVYDTRSLGFPQAVSGRGGRLVVTAGLVGWDKQFNLENDFGSQLHQAMENLAEVMADAGVADGDILHVRIYVVGLTQDHRIIVGQELDRQYPDRDLRPGTSLIGISALARDDLLVEVEGTAICG